MKISPGSGDLGALALVLLLGACASPEPVNLYGPQSARPEQAAVLFSFNLYRKQIFERANTVYVTKVDGTKIDARQSGVNSPLELPPGRHVVEIRYERDSLMCGYFGCVPFTQTTESVVFDAQAGHSYIPFASKHCDKNRIWIEDRGVSAEDDLKFWSAHHGKKGIAAVTVKAYGSSDPSRVVAGVAPGGKCDQKQAWPVE